MFVPLFAKQVFDLGNSGVGWLTMVTGVGALAGSLFLASRGTLGHRGVMLLGCLALFSTGLLLISRSDYLAFTIVVLAGTACMSNAYISLTNSLLLELSPEEMHGRVMSLLSLDRGLVPLGATIAGGLAARARAGGRAARHVADLPVAHGDRRGGGAGALRRL